MDTKIQKQFIYNGFGFPIKLINAPMRKVFGKWALDVNLNKLQLAVVYQILHSEAPLTSDEIRFLRKFLNMTTIEFGNVFGVSHPTVLNWENGTHKMAPASDVYLRLYVLYRLKVENNEFREMFNAVSLEGLKNYEGKKTETRSINIDEDLKTA